MIITEMGLHRLSGNLLLKKICPFKLEDYDKSTISIITTMGRGIYFVKDFAHSEFQVDNDEIHFGSMIESVTRITVEFTLQVIFN